MYVDGATGDIEHLAFAEFPSLVRQYDIVVLNDTRVLPARMFGVKETGGRAELLIERVLDDKRVLAQLKVSKPAKAGSQIEIQGHGGESEMIEVLGREGDFYELRFREGVSAMLDRFGHVPLPPYIQREEGVDLALDRERYQTVFAAHDGGVAAPTAGLHFDQAMLDAIRDRGAYVGFCTLHVGAGTFQPVRTDTVEEHKLHSEHMEVSDSLVKQIGRAWGREGRVIAVGTTTARALESAARSGTFGPYDGETDLFIYPGYEFRIVDALVTNFHL
ncbi:MAG: tRNA preQ1(34) S-adenosylmethionine ribosyltransferase-isomerase QueA, partial [Gammaproteobacteria bacterium]